MLTAAATVAGLTRWPVDQPAAVKSRDWQVLHALVKRSHRQMINRRTPSLHNQSRAFPLQRHSQSSLYGQPMHSFLPRRQIHRTSNDVGYYVMELKLRVVKDARVENFLPINWSRKGGTENFEFCLETILHAMMHSCKKFYWVHKVLFSPKSVVGLTFLGD